MGISDKIPCFVIVIRDNEASEYYYDYIESSWTDHGFKLTRFDAITPKDLPHLSDLQFHHHTSQKYQSVNYNKPFSDTEKAVWYSHYTLWNKCVELGTPIIVVEHDVLLLNAHHMEIYDDGFDFITFDNSFGCYYITPKLAALLISNAKRGVHTGPYGFTEMTARTHNIPHIDSEDPLFRKCAIQVLSRKYGLTNDRYSDEDMEIISKALKHDQQRIELFKNNYRFLSIP